MTNVSLFHRVMYAITADPASYNQEFYGLVTECGTAYCVAGHAMIQSGLRLTPGSSPAERHGAETGGCRDLCCAWTTAEKRPVVWTERDGNPNIHTTARDLLGIGTDDANLLFDEDNTLDRVWRMIEEITDGAVTRAAVEAEVRADLAALAEAPPVLERAR